MKLRVFLVLTLLAGLAVHLLIQNRVRPHLAGIIQQRDRNAADRDREQSGRQQVERLLENAQTDLAQRGRELEATRAELSATLATLADTQLAAQGLRVARDRIAGEKRETEQALGRWKATGVTVEQAVTFRDALKQMQSEHTRLAAANASLVQRLGEYERVLGPHPPPPATLRGTVVSVDPKWQFVVLDCGEAVSAQPTWNLLIGRAGKLIAKVEILSVRGRHSIANVLPGWRWEEVREGDSVIAETPSVAALNR